jgi:hypothetical protein
MRKAIAIFFLFVFSASFTEAGQFIKLPLLLEHYVKHRGLDNTLSFASFIKQHYLKEHKSDGDEKQDNQLPFKTYTVNTTGAVFLLTATPLAPQPVAKATMVFGVSQTRFVLSDHLFGIFHPPRIV